MQKTVLTYDNMLERYISGVSYIALHQTLMITNPYNFITTIQQAFHHLPIIAQATFF